MHCPKCDGNVDINNYCSHCGIYVVKCKFCGEVIETGKSCSKCGNSSYLPNPKNHAPLYAGLIITIFVLGYIVFFNNGAVLQSTTPPIGAGPQVVVPDSAPTPAPASAAPAESVVPAAPAAPVESAAQIAQEEKAEQVAQMTALANYHTKVGVVLAGVMDADNEFIALDDNPTAKGYEDLIQEEQHNLALMSNMGPAPPGYEQDSDFILQAWNEEEIGLVATNGVMTEHDDQDIHDAYSDLFEAINLVGDANYGTFPPSPSS